MMLPTILGCAAALLAAAMFWEATYRYADHSPAAKYGRQTTAVIAASSIVFGVLQWLRIAP